MTLGIGSYALGFLSGLLSVLSPCVLPLVPIVIGTAMAAHPLGALALAFGVAISFTSVGLFVATVGFAIGLDGDWFRHVAALLLVLLGIVLLSSPLQHRLATTTASIGRLGDRLLQRMRLEGFGGQFAVGLLLGLVWAPCVGPTLGAASLLASQGKDLGQAAVVMALFGFGAALPLAAVGAVSRRTFTGARGGMLLAGSYGKVGLGVLLIALGALMLAGLDRAAENALVDWSPAWLINITTQF